MAGLLHCGSVLISVTIKDTSGTGCAVAAIMLDGIDHRITLRDLVRTRLPSGWAIVLEAGVRSAQLGYLALPLA
jgi:hypothetical protein